MFPISFIIMFQFLYLQYPGEKEDDGFDVTKLSIFSRAATLYDVKTI